MTEDKLNEMAAAARACVKDPARITLVGGAINPRFELFHAASSLCSQKVRTVMHEKGLAYRSNEMLILGSMGPAGLVPAEHYDPAYIRLRLLANRTEHRRFVSGYSGRTSVETEGFDPCVVPLLVDYEEGKVIADSKRICCYLDGVSRKPIQLLPDDPLARAEVLHQVDIVDRIPNGALLYGFHPDGDRRPDILKAAMETVYEYKIMALERLRADHADDPELYAAYTAKIVKESGGQALRRDAAFQRAAREAVRALLVDLERDLAQSSPYLFGAAFSLADVLWGVNLTRMTYLGLASLWEDLPAVARYVKSLSRRSSLCEEAVQASASSMPPSAYLAALMTCSDTLAQPA